MNDMVDMSRFIEAKSDQLNADDLLGAPRTITITRVTGNDGDQPVSIFYEGDGGKPFKPCKTIRRVLMGVWGRYANEYVGKSMTIYRDDKVTFGGLETGGIRISHMSHIDKETVVVVMKTKGKKAGIQILPLKDAPADRTPPTEDRAARWAQAYIAEVAAAQDRADLEMYVDGKATKLAELAGKRPELHKMCTEALENRRSDFAPEGKPAAEMGEAFADADDQPDF